VILNLPPSWLPSGVSVPSEPVVRELAADHRWTAAPLRFAWVNFEDARTVGTYLVWSGTAYWTWVAEGGVRGYSLYLHELTELKWYLDHGFNPFDVREHNRNYWRAHSLALVLEHRFLQVVARTMGHDFSLKELILNNPHGTPPGRDWHAVQNYCADLLAPSDLESDAKDVAAVKRFFQELGFTM
jgi:hypothetical protein